MQTEELINTLAQDATAVSPSPAPGRIFFQWLSLLVAYISFALCFLGIRPDIASHLHSPLFDIELIVLAGFIASSLFVAAILAFPDMYQHKKSIFLPAALLVAFVVLMLLALQADNPASPLPKHNKECLICITGLSLLPGAFMLYTIRQYASTHYYTAGSIAALTAFSTGAFILRLSEETDSVVHLLQWHYLPMLAAAVIGLFIGKLSLKW